MSSYYVQGTAQQCEIDNFSVAIEVYVNRVGIDSLVSNSVILA